jgi:hypothetical protein
VIPAAGGVIVINGVGQPIGAVGVTGDTSDLDEVCAIAGISGARLTAQHDGVGDVTREACRDRCPEAFAAR